MMAAGHDGFCFHDHSLLVIHVEDVRGRRVTAVMLPLFITLLVQIVCNVFSLLSNL